MTTARKDRTEDREEWFRLALLQFAEAIGEEKAITIDELVTRIGLPCRREAEELMEKRLGDFPFPLIATAAGYFRPLPHEVDVINRYVWGNLGGRMQRLWERRRTVIRKCVAAGMQRQGKRFVLRAEQVELIR